MVGKFSTLINFDVEEFKVSEIDNSHLSKIELWVCHDKNNKNGSYLSLEAMIKAQNTIYGRPLLYRLDEDGEDFEEHKGRLFACGYVSETMTDLRYEEKNGRIYLVVSAIVWNLYMPEVLAIFKRDGKKGISMEIEVLENKKRDDGYIEFIDYRYLGIVLLGNEYQTGMFDTDAKIINFSKDEIDSMIKESEKILRYTLERNKFKEVQDKMKDFDREAHAEKFKLTSNDIRNMMKEALYAEGEYYFEDYCENYVYAYSFEDNGFVGVCYKLEDGKVTLDFGCGKKKMKYALVEAEEMKSIAFATELIEKLSEKSEAQIKELEAKIEEFTKNHEKEIEDLKAEFSEKEISLNETIESNKANQEEKDNAIFALDEKVKDLETQIEAKNGEIENLNTFKAEKEKEIRDEKVKQLFTKLSNQLTKEELESWKEKEASTESFDEFEKEISKFALDKILKDVDSGKQTFSRMSVGLQDEVQKDEEPKGIWERVEKKVKK